MESEFGGRHRPPNSYGVASPDRVPEWARVVVPVYWVLLFAVWPLAIDYPAFFSAHLASLPEDAMVFIPKTILLVASWAGGIILALALARDVHLSSVVKLVRGRRAWAWSLAFLLIWLVVAALFVNNQLLSPWLGSRQRYDGVVFQVLWWSLVPITWSIARATRSLGRKVVVVPAFVSAAIIAAWTTLESYGYEPLSLLSSQVSRASNGNAAASLGHQALVSIYLASLALALSVWFVGTSSEADARRTRRGSLASLATLVVLWAGTFGSGGRSGAYAAIGVWLAFVVWSLVRRIGRSAALGRIVLVSSLIVVAGLGIGLTNRHVQAKTEATVSGGTSFAHRLITWQVGLRAIAKRPVVGYGPDDFARQIWRFASPAQGRELLTEAVPRRYLASAKRTGDAVVYVDGNHKIHMFRLNYDKTHNYLIELAFASGIPAVLAFLAFLLFSGLDLARSADPAARVMLWGLAVFFIAVQAWFYTLPLDPLIWAWLGVALGWATASRAEAPADAGGPNQLAV